MRFTKNAFRETFKLALYELPTNESDWSAVYNEEIKPEHRDEFISHIQTAILHLFSFYIPSGKIVNCQLPHNLDVIDKKQANICKNKSCGKIFCKKHNMTYCPDCGNLL